MKKILLATLFAGLFIFVWAQKAPKKHIGDAFILRLNTMQI